MSSPRAFKGAFLKITAIHTAVLRVVGPCVYVKIETDEGITGLGECYPAAPATAVLETIAAMEEHLIGQDPRNVNVLHERIRRFNLFTGAQGGTVLHALSGLEMALWDILGKSLGVPVAQILGGRYRDRVRLYADGHAGSIDAAGNHAEEAFASPAAREQHLRESAAAAATEALEAGFGALKFDIDDAHHPSRRDAWNWTLSPREIDAIVERVAHLREVVGPEVDLALDAHARFDLPSAMQVARELAPFRPMWLEEPVPPENVEALVRVRQFSPVPICAGENVYTRFGLYDLIARGAVDVVMPDLAKFGGIMEGVRVAGYAELHGLPFAPHNVCGPVGTMAMAHACASVPNFSVLEFHGMDLPYWADLVHAPDGPILQQGTIVLSDAPGWGIELNDEVARAHLHHRSRSYFGEPL
jgi:galactonate dehydratase